jgi:hypothetical protein
MRNNRHLLRHHPHRWSWCKQLSKSQHLFAKAMHQLVNHDAWHGHQGPEPNQYSDFKDFLDTRPSLLKVAEEPLQADEWLNTTELKTEYASH